MLINKELISDDLFKYGSLFLHNSSMVTIPKFLINNWNKIEIKNYSLFVHLSEIVQRFTIDNNEVIIVGEIFVAHSDCSLYEILKNFLSTEQWKWIDLLSGRFNIYVLGDKEYVFLDPIGSKTLYYVENNGKCSNIFSNHALLLALVLDEKISESILNYKNSYEYNLKGTKFLPGDITMFDNIYGLSPNNFINLKSKTIERFYNFSTVKKTNLNELRLSVFEYYKNFSKFIKDREFIPIVGLTAGVDTRLIIAAFLFFDIDFELVTWSRGVTEEERKLINKISKYLNKKHYLIDTSTRVNNSKFKNTKILSNYNTGLSRGDCTLTVQFQENISEEKKYLFVRGLGGEILRGMFNKSISSNKNMNNLDYAISIYNTNILNKRENSNEYSSFTYNVIKDFFVRSKLNLLTDVDIGDVLYWEQRMGRWASELHNENDIAIKNFTGLNSRFIYEVAYGLDSNIRFSKKLLIDLVSIFDKRLAEFDYI